MTLTEIVLHFKTGIPEIAVRLKPAEADQVVANMVRESSSKTPGLVKIVDYEGDTVYVAADHVASMHPRKVES